MADGELRIVGERGADPDHHDVDQGTQPVQMGEPGRAIDVVGMAGLGRDPAVERLAELPDHDEVVDRAGLQRAKRSSQGGGSARRARNICGTMAQPSATSADPRSATGRSSTWNPKSCDANGVITLNNTARHDNRHGRPPRSHETPENAMTKWARNPSLSLPEPKPNRCDADHRPV